jgi:hypothetical protein
MNKKLNKSTSIQYNLFVEDNVSFERYLELSRRFFLFKLDYVLTNNLTGAFENVCTHNGTVYCRCVTFHNTY